MNKKASVTFIICTYNRADYLDQALESLFHKKQDLPKNNPFELLVVDNNSSDTTPEVVKKYQDKFNTDGKPIRYVKETEQGISFARNRGIRETTTPYIVFLDDDIRATESFISTWISFFKEHPEASAAGGKIHVCFDDPKPDWVSYFLLPLYGRHDLGDSLKKYQKNKFPFGGNMGVKKSVLAKTGDFDTNFGQRAEKLHAKGEEKDLAQRIRSVSTDIYYLPDAFVYHHVDGSRLTVKYLRKHAMGLGRSLKMRVDNGSLKQQISNLGSEITKGLGTIVLAVGYTLAFQPSKAKMLINFRRWIWKGFLTK